MTNNGCVTGTLSDTADSSTNYLWNCNGANGQLAWSFDSDYVTPPHNWTPTYNVTLTKGNRVVMPGAGPTVIRPASMMRRVGLSAPATMASAPP